MSFRHVDVALARDPRSVLALILGIGRLLDLGVYAVPLIRGGTQGHYNTTLQECTSLSPKENNHTTIGSSSSTASPVSVVNDLSTVGEAVSSSHLMCDRTTYSHTSPAMNPTG